MVEASSSARRQRAWSKHELRDKNCQHIAREERPDRVEYRRLRKTRDGNRVPAASRDFYKWSNFADARFAFVRNYMTGSGQPTIDCTCLTQSTLT